jgi:hypothetical protein
MHDGCGHMTPAAIFPSIPSERTWATMA